MESAKQATHTSQVETTQSVQSGSSQSTPTNRILSHASPLSATGSPSVDRIGPPSVPPIGPRVVGSQAPVLAVPSDDLTDQEKAIEILKMAGDAFASNGNWVVFYRDMLGVNGVARRAFNTEAKFEQFQKTPQFAELQEMVAALRSQDTSKGDAVEPEKMITIRLPESLHQVLTAEAESMNLSINKLCISKLLQPVESRFVPVQQGRRRGRRPGPQGSRKGTQSPAS